MFKNLGLSELSSKVAENNNHFNILNKFGFDVESKEKYTKEEKEYALTRMKEALRDDGQIKVIGKGGSFVNSPNKLDSEQQKQLKELYYGLLKKDIEEIEEIKQYKAINFSTHRDSIGNQLRKFYVNPDMKGIPDKTKEVSNFINNYKELQKRYFQVFDRLNKDGHSEEAMKLIKDSPLGQVFQDAQGLNFFQNIMENHFAD